MSKTTSSPRPISRSPGSACGSAPLGPAATIAGKEGSPPSSRIRASAARATSRSVRPPRPRSSAPAPDLVGQLRGGGDRRQLRLVLDPAQLLDVAAGGDQLDPVGEFLLESLQRPNRDVVVLEADPAARAARRSRRASRRSTVIDLPALDLGLGALGVAEVGEEEAELGAADAGAVGAGEPGQVADVDQVGDEDAGRARARRRAPARRSPRPRISSRSRRARAASSSSASR